MRIKICGITQPQQAMAIAQLGATALGFICVPSSSRYVTPLQIQLVTKPLLALPDGKDAPRLSIPKSSSANPSAANPSSANPSEANPSSAKPSSANPSAANPSAANPSAANPNSPKPIDRVGVFANADLETICDTVATGLLNGVQLHGDESLDFCQQVKQALPGIEVIKAFRIRDKEALAQTYAYASEIDTILLDAYHPTLLGGTGHTLDWSLLQSFQPDCPWLLAGGLNPGNVAEAIAQVRPDGIDLSSGVEDAPGIKNLDKVRDLFQQVRTVGG